LERKLDLVYMLWKTYKLHFQQQRHCTYSTTGSSEVTANTVIFAPAGQTTTAHPKHNFRMVIVE